MYRPGSIEPSPISSTSAFAVSIVRLPPFGIASRAFTTRFITTWWSWPGSASIGPRAGSSCVVRTMSSPISGRSIDCISTTMPFRFRSSGVSTCLRLNARSWRVSRAARSVAFLISSRSALQRRAVLGVLEREGGVAADRGQHVVEVVSHAAGEPADRLELLALAKLLLEQLALGDVLGHPDREVRLAVGVAHERDRKMGHDRAAVLGQEARLAPVRVAIAADQLRVETSRPPRRRPGAGSIGMCAAAPRRPRTRAATGPSGSRS